MSVTAYGCNCPFIFKKRDTQNKETTELKYYDSEKSEHEENTESKANIQKTICQWQQKQIKIENESLNSEEDFKLIHNSITSALIEGPATEFNDEQQPILPSSKGTKTRRKLTLVEKEMILKVFDALYKDHPNKCKDEVVIKCCEYTGTGRSTVYKILREKKVHGQVKPPIKCLGKPPKIIDEDARNFIKQKVLQSLYDKNEQLTLRKLLQALEDNNLPKIGRTKLWETVKEIKEEVRGKQN